MIRLFIILIFSLISRTFPLRSQPAIDSLKRLLYEVNDNQLRVDVLNELAYVVYDIDVSEGFGYASEAHDHSKIIKYVNGERKALILMGYRFTLNGEFYKAMDYYRKSAAINSSDDYLSGYGYTMTANVYRSLAKYDSARLFYLRSIKILEENPNPPYLAFAFYSLAQLSMIQWKNNEAEFYFKKALKIYEEEGDDRGRVVTWFALSDVSKNLTDYKMANDYLNKGCELANRSQGDFLILLCYKNQGDFYFRMSDYLKSLEVLFKALEILKTNEQPQLLASL